MNNSALASSPSAGSEKNFFVKLNMLKRGISDPRMVERFCVQRGVKLNEDDQVRNLDRGYSYEYIINEKMGPLPREHYDKFLQDYYHMHLIQDFLVW